VTSAIDPTVPNGAAANSADLRANLQAAHDEIEALQADVATLQTDVGTLQQANGVTDGSDPQAGQIGEVVFANVLTEVNAPNNVPVDLTTITLSAGDWDVEGAVYFQANSSAGTDDLRGWVNTVSVTQPTGESGGLAIMSTSSGGLVNMIAIPPLRLNVTVSTVVYLSCNADFGSGSMQVKGFVRARRMR
jgi:hypothetical protein